MCAIVVTVPIFYLFFHVAVRVRACMPPEQSETLRFGSDGSTRRRTPFLVPRAPADHQRTQVGDSGKHRAARNF